MFAIESLHTEDIHSSINKLVPTYQRDLVIAALNLPMPTEADFDNIGLELTGEKRNLSFILTTSAPVKHPQSMWGAIKSEVYKFVCTESSEYESERKKCGITLGEIVTIIATSLAAKLNICIGVITGAITVVFISIIKITKNVWCVVNSPTI